MSWTGWTHQVDLNKLIKLFNKPNKVLVSLSECFWSWSSRKDGGVNLQFDRWQLELLSSNAVHWHKTALLLSVVYMKRITDYIEKEQIHTLLEYTRTCNPRDYLMLWLWWRDGGVSELPSMKPSDIEFHNQVANIWRPKGGNKGGPLRRGDISPILQLHFHAKHLDDVPVFAI